MPAQFSTTTTTGYGSRITNSIKGVLFGLILFAGSFILLYWNEGRVDLSLIAKTAVEIRPETAVSDPSLMGKLVSATGAVSSSETVGDNLFLKPGAYLAVERTVEMYAWVEHEKSESKTNVGGSETTVTTYDYTREWTSQPRTAFRYPEGHENPGLPYGSGITRVQNAAIGAYTLDMASVDLPPFSPLPLANEKVTLPKGVGLPTSEYIFIPATATSTLQNPAVGDIRVRYGVIPSGMRGTVFGKAEGSMISPYFDAEQNRLYRLFSGTRDEAIATLRTEYVTMTWILRGVGFLMMWFGLVLLFGPVSVLLDILPVFGAVSRSLIGIATFVVSLVLSIVTIVVSMVAHSFVALLISLAVTVGVMVVLLILWKKKKLRAA